MKKQGVDSVRWTWGGPWCVAACVLLGGCAGGPLGERDSDLARRLDPARTRSVERLEIERFRAPPRGAPAGELAGAGEDAARAQRLGAMSTVELSIADVRAGAIAHNLNLRTALYDPSIAREGESVERAKFDAVFTPRVEYSDTNTGSRNEFSPSSVTGVRTGRLGSGVSVPLRTGGRASVDLLGTGSDTAGVGNGQNLSADLAFSLSQPLLRGAGREIATASIKIAGYEAQITETRTKLRVIAELSEADRAYWRLSAARRALLVRQQEYEVARQQLERAQRRVQAGESPEIELIRAQSGLASRLEAIITAENDVLLTQRELKRRVNTPGLDVDSPAAIVPTTEPALFEYELDAPRLTELAIAARMELLENELALLQDAVNVQVARNGVLPGLDLSASYTLRGSGDTIGTTGSSLGHARYGGVTLGISGNVPLGNEAAEANLRRTLLTRLQRLGTRASREQTVRQDVLDAIDRVRAGWQRVMAARQASILAGRTLAGEQRQFDAGTRTSTEVLDAASRLSAAQLAEVQAMSDYQIAQVDLAVATGTVLGAAGASFQPLGDEELRVGEESQRRAQDQDRRRRNEHDQEQP